LASICGTDIGIYDWTPWAESHITPPIVIGHEILGEVLEINGDNPNGITVGDLVSSETHIFCGKCHQCQIGNRHVCENMQLFGIGGMVVLQSTQQFLPEHPGKMINQSPKKQ